MPDIRSVLERMATGFEPDREAYLSGVRDRVAQRHRRHRLATAAVSLVAVGTTILVLASLGGLWTNHQGEPSGAFSTHEVQTPWDRPASVPTDWHAVRSDCGMHAELFAAATSSTALDGLVQGSFLSNRCGFHFIGEKGLGPRDAYVEVEQVSAMRCITCPVPPPVPPGLRGEIFSSGQGYLGGDTGAFSGSGGDDASYEVRWWVGPQASARTGSELTYLLHHLRIPPGQSEPTPSHVGVLSSPITVNGVTVAPCPSPPSMTADEAYRAATARWVDLQPARVTVTCVSWGGDTEWIVSAEGDNICPHAPSDRPACIGDVWNARVDPGTGTVVATYANGCPVTPAEAAAMPPKPLPALLGADGDPSSCSRP